MSPGFESVYDMFQQNLRDGEERHAQICVYVGLECVVDLWGSSDKVESEKFGPDSLVNVFSSTKCIEAIVMAKCVDEGRIRHVSLKGFHTLNLILVAIGAWITSIDGFRSISSS